MTNPCRCEQFSEYQIKPRCADCPALQSDDAQLTSNIVYVDFEKAKLDVASEA